MSHKYKWTDYNWDGEWAWIWNTFTVQIHEYYLQTGHKLSNITVKK